MQAKRLSYGSEVYCKAFQKTVGQAWRQTWMSKPMGYDKVKSASVTAPCDALLTADAYFASTPFV
ncbi:MAG: hypothetical protein AMXMBFR84_07010 [Candidatus Hydrogenedentota bacterium]